MAQCPHAITINAMWPYAIHLISFLLKNSILLLSVLLLFFFSSLLVSIGDNFFSKLFKGSIFKSENSDFEINLLQRSILTSL